MDTSSRVVHQRSKAQNGFAYRATALAAILGLVGLFLGGCFTSSQTVTPPTKVTPDIQVLNPGDVIRITFPGTPNLDVNQTIRRDGKLNLFIIGEIKAADKTPKQLEEELAEAYKSQLLSKEVNVTVVSSSFVVFVTGAVVRPGKVVADRPLTAFDAIMEAGGFDIDKANTKKVRVIRQEDGQIKTYPLNMKTVLEGTEKEPFYLKMYDSVYVPEKLTIF